MDAASQAIAMSVPEEEQLTPSFLIRIGFFIAIGFGVIAILGEEEFRPFTIGLGGVFVVAAAFSLIHILRQRRYGTATLRAVRPYEDGKPFEGYIETEVRERPTGPVRVRIFATFGRSQRTLARARIDPSRLRMTSAGTLQIPFFVAVPQGRWNRGGRDVRLRAQTASWPHGWGGTFLIGSSE